MGKKCKISLKKTPQNALKNPKIWNFSFSASKFFFPLEFSRVFPSNSTFPGKKNWDLMGKNWDLMGKNPKFPSKKNPTNSLKKPKNLEFFLFRFPLFFLGNFPDFFLRIPHFQEKKWDFGCFFLIFPPRRNKIIPGFINSFGILSWDGKKTGKTGKKQKKTGKNWEKTGKILDFSPFLSHFFSPRKRIPGFFSIRNLGINPGSFPIIPILGIPIKRWKTRNKNHRKKSNFAIHNSPKIPIFFPIKLIKFLFFFFSRCFFPIFFPFFSRDSGIGERGFLGFIWGGLRDGKFQDFRAKNGENSRFWGDFGREN
ncbi:uncharacterized protein LOC131592355 isoform X2 [Poecile atricapillus]|uniref:uncharacterized protein LOC131592355 isoform X2 n=1 Tax=Poecile atricapillus TaxID=48891 RepID=UPI002739EBF3|nr:uncharacterized protein LOC131592355 isoform X2 [Poecile atricapillus]